MVEADWKRIASISGQAALNIPMESVHCGMTGSAQLAALRGLAEPVCGSAIIANRVLSGLTLWEAVLDFLAQKAKDAGEVDPDALGQDLVAEHRPKLFILA